MKDNLYKAAKDFAVVSDHILSIIDDHFYNKWHSSFIEFKQAITAYEHEQTSMDQKNGNLETKEDILSVMIEAMPWHLNPKIKAYVSEAMEIYSDQQTYHLKAENKILKQRVSDLENELNDLNNQ